MAINGANQLINVGHKRGVIQRLPSGAQQLQAVGEGAAHY
jgi:hypothetical protein